MICLWESFSSKKTIILVCAAVAVLVAALVMVKILFFPNLGFKTVSLRSSSRVSAVSSSTPSSSAAKSSSTASISTAPGDYSYFKDAVFIGDSITEGISHFSITENAGILTTNSISVASALKTKVNYKNNKIPLLDAVKSIKPPKVYILLGGNDLSWMNESSFESHYSQILDALKAALPDAAIYVQSVFPVTANYESSHKLTNVKIDAANKALKTISEQKGVKYLDVASVFRDSSGKMALGNTSDGYNIRRSAYTKWLNYLTQNK